MPSGAKRRKAAKKKKEKEANNTHPSSTDNNSNIHGHDDPKSQDERDSDGGEVGSNASQDQQNRDHSFSEGDQESEKRDTSPVQSFVSENKSMEEIPDKIAERAEILGQQDDAVVEIERQLENEDLDRRYASIKHVEHDRRSGSSSSSDDESQAYEKKLKEETYDSTSEPISKVDEGKPANSRHEDVGQVTENVSFGVGEADSISAAETAFVGNVVKPVLSAPEEVNPIIESASINNSVASDAVELVVNESEEKLLPKTNGVSGVQSEGNNDKMLPPSSALTGETSNVVENTQDSEIPDYCEKQPLVASTPPVVRRTSWLSCCGLFEVLSGSGR